LTLNFLPIKQPLNLKSNSFQSLFYKNVNSPIKYVPKHLHFPSPNYCLLNSIICAYNFSLFSLQKLPPILAYTLLYYLNILLYINPISNLSKLNESRPSSKSIPQHLLQEYYLITINHFILHEYLLLKVYYVVLSKPLNLIKTTLKKPLKKATIIITIKKPNSNHLYLFMT
jgi:hypothetical protein